ncbi:putative N6-adenine methyltransferase-domain-containing protein [Lineolata rhizophorae]|uniref:Protein-lysine N-methyltransferase EFM5 n=1 Tax=Lineolata rhizophorae TaxID=578093 RepID=A0A6A6P693_9PEZI|nr:putative N6-adenine methyltransferase-domain-containing protein [Lineolata rhizophorae]
MNSPKDDTDDAPQLTLRALDALKEFYNERDSIQRQFEELKNQADTEFTASRTLSMSAFTENWNASQFWYSDQTATVLALALLEGTTDESHIAIVSAPSVFVQLKNLLAASVSAVNPQLALLEYDERFSIFKEFVAYDFANPLKLPGSLKGNFDRIICDPPFLSEDCQAKAALTVRWLMNSEKQTRIIVCTGERMESLILKLYSKTGVRTTTFEPQHTKGLSNEFRCYANFESKEWTWCKS